MYHAYGGLVGFVFRCVYLLRLWGPNKVVARGLFTFSELFTYDSRVYLGLACYSLFDPSFITFTYIRTPLCFYFNWALSVYDASRVPRVLVLILPLCILLPDADLSTSQRRSRHPWAELFIRDKGELSASEVDPYIPLFWDSLILYLSETILYILHLSSTPYLLALKLALPGPGSWKLRGLGETCFVHFYSFPSLYVYVCSVSFRSVVALFTIFTMFSLLSVCP